MSVGVRVGVGGGDEGGGEGGMGWGKADFSEKNIILFKPVKSDNDTLSYHVCRSLNLPPAILRSHQQCYYFLRPPKLNTLTQYCSIRIKTSRITVVHRNVLNK